MTGEVPDARDRERLLRVALHPFDRERGRRSPILADHDPVARRSWPSRNNTAGPSRESTWPTITAGPRSPGLGPSRYQPARSTSGRGGHRHDRPAPSARPGGVGRCQGNLAGREAAAGGGRRCLALRGARPGAAGRHGPRPREPRRRPGVTRRSRRSTAGTSMAPSVPRPTGTTRASTPAAGMAMDTGLGGAAGQLRQPVVVLAAAATVLAALLLVLAARRRATSTSGSAG